MEKCNSCPHASLEVYLTNREGEPLRHINTPRRHNQKEWGPRTFRACRLLGRLCRDCQSCPLPLPEKDILRREEAFLNREKPIPCSP